MSPRKVLRYQTKREKSPADYEAIFVQLLLQMDRGVEKSELARRLVSDLELDVGFIAIGSSLIGKTLERMIGDRIGRKLTELEKEKLDTLLTVVQMKFSGGLIEWLDSGARGGLSGGLIYKKAGDNPDSKDDPRFKPTNDGPRSPLDGLGGFFKR